MAEIVADNAAELGPTQTRSQADRPSRAGQWVVATMFALAIAAALFAWGWRKTQTDDSLAFWGAENAEAIRAGEKITLMRLGDSGLQDSPEVSAITLPNGIAWVIEETRDLSDAKGITHARRAFIEDSSFDWKSLSESAEPKRLDFAVRFQKGSAPPVTIGIDLEGSRFYHIESGRSLQAHPKMMQGWKDYAGRQFAEERSP